MSRSRILPPLFLFLTLSLFLTLFTGPMAKAVSAQSTGFNTQNWNTNQDTYARVGVYHVFSAANKLVVYDNTGNLVRDYSYVYAYTPTAWYTAVRIMAINDTFVLACYVYGANTQTSRVKAGLLNVESGAWTTLVSDVDLSGTTSRYPYGLVLMNYSGSINMVTSVYIDQAWRSCVIYPAYGGSLATYSVAGFTNKYLNGSCIAVHSETVAEEWYICALTSISSANRTQLFKYNIVTDVATELGTTGVDNTWSGGWYSGSGSTNGAGYTYFFGSSYDTNGVSNWYDIGVVYNNPALNGEMFVGVYRFNETYFGYSRSTLSPSTAALVLRCISVPYSGVRSDTTELLEGSYRFVYVGSSYAMMQCPFEVENLDSSSFNCYISASPSTYQGKTHYYNTTSNLGGYQPETANVVWLVNCATNASVADLWTATNPEFSYVYMLSPDPISQLDMDFSGYLGTSYAYTGEIFISQVLQGNGTFQVLSTGLLSSPPTGSSTYSLVGAGIVQNGVLQFTISARISSMDLVYEGLKVNITITAPDSTFYTATHAVTWVLEEGGPLPSATDIGTISTFTTAQLLALLIPGLLFIGIPTLFVILIGFPGVYIGTVLATIVTVWAWPTYFFWIVPLVGLVLVLLIFMRHR